jgi:rubrerythrin
MAIAKEDPLDVLKNAISMEIEGKEFFEAAAQRMKHP